MKTKRIITVIILLTITICLGSRMDVSATEPTKFGTVTGTMTYKYNDFKGEVSDTHSLVMLIPRTEEIRTKDFNIEKADWDSLGILSTTVNGKGKYIINHVPEGQYICIAISTHTNTRLGSEAFCGKKKKIARRKRVRNIRSDIDYGLTYKTIESIVRYSIGHTIFSSSIVDVYDREKTDVSYDFGITYLNTSDLEFD